VLRKLVRRIHSDDRGFTLIELMIVILVILVLAAILLPQFGLARERARKASCVSNQRNLETAVAMWQTDNPSTDLNQGVLSASTTVPQATTLSGTPQYTLAGTYKEPDDSGSTQTSGADYFLSAGGTTANTTAPSYGHVVCVYAFGAGANPDPWGGVGPISASSSTSEASNGVNLNHARGSSASP
jgi:prepilin-type N-terminal cleavage/methylation domain-containing protein